MIRSQVIYTPLAGQYMHLFLAFLTFGVLNAQLPSRLDSLFQVHKQAKGDSAQIKTLQDYVRQLSAHDINAALDLAHQALDQSRQVNWQQGQADAYYQLGRLQAMVNALDSARFYYEKSIPIFQQLGDEPGLATTYWFLGNTLTNLDAYDTGLSYYRQALDLFEKHDMQSSIMAASINCGWVLSELGSYPEAVVHLLQAMRLADSLEQPRSTFNARHELIYVLIEMGELEQALIHCKDNETLAQTLADSNKLSIAFGDLGLYYHESGQYELGLSYDLQDLAIQQALGHTKDIPLILNNIGSAYIKLGQYQKALDAMEESLNYGGQHRDAYNQALSYLLMGQAHHGLRNINQADRYLNLALDQAIGLNNTSLIRDAREQLIEVYRQTGDYRAAFGQQTLLQALKDSLLNLEKQKALAELQTKYETERKEKEIALQQVAIQDLEFRNKQERMRRTLALTALLLTGLIGFLIINRQRLRMRKNKQIRIQEKRAMQAEQQALKLQQEKLNRELNYKKKELTSHTLHLIRKNELLEELQDEITTLKQQDQGQRGLDRLGRMIRHNQRSDDDWENFRQYFNQVHPDFDRRLKNDFPDLTSNDLKLAALLKMNLSSKQIASISNISMMGVKKARYRLRKKLQLEDDARFEDMLVQY